MKEKVDNWIKIMPERNLLGLTELEYSALHSWVVDSAESFDKIYNNLLVRLGDNKIDDDMILECLVDILFELRHIKNHIEDSEIGLSELIEFYAKK